MRQNLQNVFGVFGFAYFVDLAQKWLFDDNVPYLEKPSPKIPSIIRYVLGISRVEIRIPYPKIILDFRLGIF